MAVPLLLVVIAMAGCAARPAVQEPPTGPIHTGLEQAEENEDVDRRLLPYNQTDVKHVRKDIELRVFQGKFPSGTSFYSGTTNCASLGVDRLLNGTVTAVWQPLPGMDTVEVRIEGTYVAVSAVGVSPLTLPLEHGFADDGYVVALHAPPDTVLVDQQFDVTLDFHHIGGGGQVDATSCA